MNKFQTHQTKHTFCTNGIEIVDLDILTAEDQLFLRSLRPRLDQLVREPSEDVLCSILTYAELL
jgi:hypothetical protein